MAVATFLRSLKGDFAGESRLNLSWQEDPIKICKSTAKLEVDPSETFAKLEYEWAYEGEKQYGILIAVGDTGAWTDSWHMGAEAMFLSGSAEAQSFNVKGEYKVEGHPNWGWGIELTPTENGFQMCMFNVSPEGDEEWAVEADYRQPSE